MSTTTSTTVAPTTPALSSDTIDWLRAAYGMRTRDNFMSLLTLVHALRTAGWTLAAIAAPLDVSREIVRQWQVKAAEVPDLPKVTVETPPKKPKPKAEIESIEAAERRKARDALEIEVLERNLPRLRELQPHAEALRGPSEFNPVGAAASAEYTRLIDETLKAGVRSRVLASELGVQVITLHARLRRSGLRKTAPSEHVPGWAKPGWADAAS